MSMLPATLLLAGSIFFFSTMLFVTVAGEWGRNVNYWFSNPTSSYGFGLLYLLCAVIITVIIGAVLDVIDDHSAKLARIFHSWLWEVALFGVLVVIIITMLHYSELEIAVYRGFLVLVDVGLAIHIIAVRIPQRNSSL